MIEIPSDYRKQLHVFNDPGHAHFLTFSCYHRQLFLNRDRTRTWFIEAIKYARTEHHFDLWAYVIMPEHAHLVILPRESIYNMSEIRKSLKQSVSKTATFWVKKNAPQFLPRMADQQSKGRIIYRFWQRGGGYDTNLVSPKVIWDVIDYNHMNPVNRGLCVRPEEWEWSSASWYILGIPGPIDLNLELLPIDPRRR